MYKFLIKLIIIHVIKSKEKFCNKKKKFFVKPMGKKTVERIEEEQAIAKKYEIKYKKNWKEMTKLSKRRRMKINDDDDE